MKKFWKKKLIDRRGFTLAEALIAIIIMLLVSAIVAAGVPAAANAVDKAVTAANAQVLLSTAVGELRDQLRTARDIRVEGTTVKYYSADINSDAEISRTSTGDRAGEIMLKEFLAYGTGIYTGDGAVSADYVNKTIRQLVTTKAATNDLFVAYDSAAYDPVAGTVTFTGLKVFKESDATPKAALDDADSTLVVRVAG